MNELEYYFYNNESLVIDRWQHYFKLYHRYFEQYRDGDINILEIGVQNGGSSHMWRNYFGNRCNVYGIDIDDTCKKFETDWFKVYIGDQSNILFLNKIKKECPKFDIIIDDGGHRSKQMIISFEELFDHLKYGGVYWVEDLHCNYLNQFGGQLNDEFSFTNYLRKLIDNYHLYSFDIGGIDRRYLENLGGVYFHESIVVLEKTLNNEKSKRVTSGKDYSINVI